MAKSCFEELKVDAFEITPGPRTGGRAIGPAHFWRRLAFAGLRNGSTCVHPLHHLGDGARAARFEEARA
jgi:hypothetical protein